MIVYNYDADLEVSDTCVRSSLLSWVELLLSCSLEEYSRSHLALTPPTLLTNNLLSHLTEPTLVLTPLTVLANQYAYQARHQVISRESKSGPSNKITSGSTECRGII